MKKPKTCLMMRRRQTAQLTVAVERPRAMPMPMVRSDRVAVAAVVVAAGAVTRQSRAARVKQLLGPATPMRVRQPRSAMLPEKGRLQRVNPVMKRLVAAVAAVAAAPVSQPKVPLRHLPSGRGDRPTSHRGPDNAPREGAGVATPVVVESPTDAVVAARRSPASVKAVMRMMKGWSFSGWTSRRRKLVIVGRLEMKNCWPKAASTASAMSPVGSKRSAL